MFNKSRQFAGAIRPAVFAVTTHLLEQFNGASLHIVQTNRAPGLLTSRALNKMIASATKACQRNTLQGIGQSAGFWFLVHGFWFKSGLKFPRLIGGLF